MNPYRVFFALLLCGLAFSSILYARDTTISRHIWKETGVPYIQNFSPKDYQGGTQNFSIVQDQRGLIYVGNSWGVLVYDGVSWRLIALPNQSTVRSLRLVNDRIYAGAVDELGYLEADANGRLTYVSLLHAIPEEHRNFKDVYTIISFGDDLLFRTRRKLFRLSDGRIHIWESDADLRGAYVIDGNLYIEHLQLGLTLFGNDSLQSLPGGEVFSDISITAMLPHDDSGILICTLNDGLYLYDGTGIRKMHTPADEVLYQNQVRDGIALPDGLYAFGTRSGAIIIDNAGNICQVVNKTTGLLDELTISLSSDRQGGIWLALNNGIARVEMPSPVSRFQDASGLGSFVGDILRHNGRIYTTTDRGVYYLDETDYPLALFKPVTGITSLSWSLLTVGEQLLVGNQEAIFKITGTNAERVTDLSAIRLHRSMQDSTILFAGLLEGLAVLKFENESWRTLGRIPTINERITAIVEDYRGYLWLGTQNEGILKISLHPIDDQTEIQRVSDIVLGADIERFGERHGLPSGPTTPSAVGKRIVFKTTKGLRQFDAVRQLFIPDSTYGTIFADTLCWINHIRTDQNENVWIVAGKGLKNYNGTALLQSDGTYRWQETPFLRMNDLGRVYFSYPETNRVVWFGGAEGIARYSSDIPKDYRTDYATVIRYVSGISVDSIYYSGASPGRSPHPEIKHTDNSLRFEFSALSYDDPSANRYQVWLEGFDEDWSNWSSDTKKDYTGLPAGTYNFRVRGKNIYDHVSREDVFSFTILHPWYQTWWALLVYTLIGGLIVFGIVKFRVRHLEKKTIELESIIDERTRVIRDQAEKLLELDKLKSRFYANISHEFRTPLTLILGPLEELIARTKEKDDKDDFNMMYRNARRLLRLINELLDLSRLESGKLKLETVKSDIISFLKGIVMSFASLADQKQITLEFRSSPDIPEIYFDPEKSEKIFSNLLSNAFKFTPAGGKISCIASIAECGSEAPSGKRDSGLMLDCQCIEIRIIDTGIGIPTDRLPYIFDRFYQVDSSSTREHEGTGIGLALTKELIVLHRGSIEVESIEGQGTTFTVRLPSGRNHLRPEEIVAEDVRPRSDAGHPADIELTTVQETELPVQNSLPESEGGSEDIVLIVDDHPDVRKYLRAHLEKDYFIVEASDGQHGLDTAVEVIPDLIISDVMMPKLDGNQFCSAIKTNEKTSHIPVILLTAKAGEQDKLSGLETGADDYLTKPFSAKQLQVRVRNLIEQRRMLRLRFVREGILQPREVAVTSTDEAFLHRLMSGIEENLGKESFGVNELGEIMFMGTRQLHRKVRGLTGKSPVELIRSVRLHRARKLLESRAGTVTEIALQVGFNNLSHFAKVFREEFGKLPSEI